ncbi:MAG: alpha-galactosidase, partial [Sphaerochaetaceae bacterium]|nr:alpha-galactosidase [Sphaerochaetaceae bacterium]
MSIEFDQTLFHFKTPNSSYVMKIERDRYLVHLGWYGALASWNAADSLPLHDRSFSPNPAGEERNFSLDTIPLEYSGWGRGDFRSPALVIQGEDGSTSVDLIYRSHDIVSGKPGLEGLPAVYVEDATEADTLQILLEDPLTGLQCELSYSVFSDRDVITRSVRLRNTGGADLQVQRVMSLCLDFNGSGYRMMQLSGAHNRERSIHVRTLAPGSQNIESTRGASSHQQNPFIALLEEDCGDEFGTVYGFNLVYSGNFLATVEVDQFDSSRVLMGINPFDFTWKLAPGESFQAPEVVMVRSSRGVDGMSMIFHDLYRKRLVRGFYRDRERPVLI